MLLRCSNLLVSLWDPSVALVPCLELPREEEPPLVEERERDDGLGGGGGNASGDG